MLQVGLLLWGLHKSLIKGRLATLGYAFRRKRCSLSVFHIGSLILNEFTGLEATF